MAGEAPASFAPAGRRLAIGESEGTRATAPETGAIPGGASSEMPAAFQPARRNSLPTIRGQRISHPSLRRLDHAASLLTVDPTNDVGRYLLYLFSNKGGFTLQHL